MTFVFEITDKTGRKIHLTKERWVHITSPASLHPYMANYFEEVKQTLEKPDLIVQQKFDDSKANYYKHIKKEKAYLLVGVKYLNGEGFVITSFLTRKIMRR
jgi:hypothetical protein